jgi:hypothetical protein
MGLRADQAGMAAAGTGALNFPAPGRRVRHPGTILRGWPQVAPCCGGREAVVMSDRGKAPGDGRVPGQDLREPRSGIPPGHPAETAGKMAAPVQLVLHAPR